MGWMLNCLIKVLSSACQIPLRGEEQKCVCVCVCVCLFVCYKDKYFTPRKINFDCVDLREIYGICLGNRRWRAAVVVVAVGLTRGIFVWFCGTSNTKSHYKRA